MVGHEQRFAGFVVGYVALDGYLDAEYFQQCRAPVADASLAGLSWQPRQNQGDHDEAGERVPGQSYQAEQAYWQCRVRVVFQGFLRKWDA